MKNIPDKIYILRHEDYSDRRILNAFTEKELDTEIEYVRKDAFIEKAEKWLNEHILDYVYVKEWGQGVGVEGELFDDFKEYMKLVDKDASIRSFNEVFSQEEIDAVDKRILDAQEKERRRLEKAWSKVKDFQMNN